MLTILELGGAEPARLDALARLLDSLGDSGSNAGTRWIVVQPDRGSWAEARGRSLLVEHVEAPRWSARAPEQAFVRADRLAQLVLLHKPALIVCHSPLLSPILVRVLGMTLDPRPAVVCTWVDGGTRAWAERGLARVDARLAERGGRALGWWTDQGLDSFDALFVTSRAAARRLSGRGIERLYYVPRGADLARFHPERSPVSKRAPCPGPEPLFIEAPPGVELGLLRRVWAKLRMLLPREAGAVVHAGTNLGMARFVSRRRGLRLCPHDDLDARADALATAEVALILPGFDDGHSAVAEALASGCTVVAAGVGAEWIEAGDCGRVLELDGLGGDALAEAVIAELEREDRAQAQARARLRAEAEAEIGLCLARELTCMRDVVGRVRAGGVTPGLRELEPSVDFGGRGPVPLPVSSAAPAEPEERDKPEAGEPA